MARIRPPVSAAEPRRELQRQPQGPERWADERLTLTRQRRRHDRALFRYEGTTCSNMGRAIAFRLSREARTARAKVIRSANRHCGPRPAMKAIRYMCRYMTNAEHLMVAIDHEKPLLGQPLNDVLTWHRPRMARAVIASRPAANTNGAWCWRRFITRWCRRTGRARSRTRAHAMKKPLLEAYRRAPPARRRRDGHAAHDRRPGAGKLRRRVEPHASRKSARDSAALRRGRLGLHPHQHLRRLAHHAQSPRQRRQGRRRSTRPPSRSSARRSAIAKATSSATSARSAG